MSDAGGDEGGGGGGGGGGVAGSRLVCVCVWGGGVWCVSSAG